MSAPTQLTITLTGSLGTVVIPIPAALTALDSTSPGATPTGFSGADQLIRAIFRAGVFYVASTGTWYAASQIVSIVSS